jgi:acid stress-induced BolA-like protein IbaG/YrbA
MKSNNIKQHIKNHVDMKAAELKAEKYKFKNVTRVDFDLEIEGLQFQIKKLAQTIEKYDNVLDAVNFQIIVIAQMLQDNKLVTEDNIQDAAKKINKLKRNELERFEKEKVAAYKEILANSNIKGVEA